MKIKLTASHHSHDLFVDIDNIYFLQQNVSVCITFHLILHQIPHSQSEGSLVPAMQTKRKEIFCATITSLIYIVQNYPANKFS